jgi:hypothetical protein
VAVAGAVAEVIIFEQIAEGAVEDLRSAMELLGFPRLVGLNAPPPATRALAVACARVDRVLTPRRSAIVAVALAILAAPSQTIVGDELEVVLATALRKGRAVRGA